MQRILQMLAGSTMPWEHALDGVITVMIAAAGLLAPTIALLFRPVNKGDRKRFWLCGAAAQVAMHALAWCYSMGNGGFCILAIALTVVQGLLFRSRVEDTRRLMIALGVQAFLTMGLYIGLNIAATTAVMMVMYR